MTDPPPPAGAAPMEGHGVYNRSSCVQAAGFSPALPLWRRRLGGCRWPAPPADRHRRLRLVGGPELARPDRGGDPRPPRPGRRGTADFRRAYRPAEQRFQRPVPGPGDDPASYLRDDPASFAFAVGRSFYRQILPAGSVTLGWSSWAVQWLSRTPCPIPDQFRWPTAATRRHGRPSPARPPRIGAAF